MFGSARVQNDPPPQTVLDLSGTRLRRSFEALITGAENSGGIEAYVTGVRFKTELFQETLGGNGLAGCDGGRFAGLCAYMAPVRRRIGTWLDGNDFTGLHVALTRLLDGAERTADAATVDARITEFCSAFPDGKRFRWVRDLAGEILHNLYPEIYPLMARWVWDRQSNTGVLREIWYGDIDHLTLDVPDGYETFLVLRQELSTFLSDNGVFRDMPCYVDLLCAQIYAEYICEQGGTYLRTDFASDHDPLQYTRRMLGLDGVDPETGRSRMKPAG